MSTTPSHTIPRTFTTSQVAHMLGVSENNVRNAAKRDGLNLGDGIVVHPIRVNSRIIWPATPIATALDLTDDNIAAITAK